MLDNVDIVAATQVPQVGDNKAPTEKDETRVKKRLKKNGEPVAMKLAVNERPKRVIKKPAMLHSPYVTKKKVTKQVDENPSSQPSFSLNIDDV